MNTLKIILLAVLLLLALIMLVFGFMNSMLPPIVTGIGFAIIALLFITNKNERGR